MFLRVWDLGFGIWNGNLGIGILRFGDRRVCVREIGG